jgi:cytochrome c
MKFPILTFAALLLAACSDNSGAAVQSPQSAAPDTRAEQGRQAFGQCGVCHSSREGDGARVGPNLFGVYGRTAGTADGFAYSSAMRDSGVVWSDETLDAFIKNPQSFIRGNRMGYAGERDAQQRANIIAFLKTLQPDS